MHLCEDCKGYGASYMVHPHVWRKAVPPSETHQTPCLNCLQKRLGRQLVAADFDFAYAINAGIALGVRMGRQEGIDSAVRSARARLREQRKKKTILRPLLGGKRQ